MSIGIFTLPLAADEVREVDITGEYFELRNALSPVLLIELLDRSGGVVSRLDNPEQSDFVRPGRYEKIRITNGPVAQTVRHFYGSGDAGSRRTSGLVQVEGTVETMGTTEVVDSSVARTIAGQGFGWQNFVAAVAAQYAYSQIWNPVGSGKRVRVDSARLAASAATQALLFVTDVALATVASQANGHNKLSGGAASVAQGRNTSSAASLGTGKQLHSLSNVTNGVDAVLEFSYPIILLPGYGLTMQNTSLNLNQYCTFEFVEEAYP